MADFQETVLSKWIRRDLLSGDTLGQLSESYATNPFRYAVLDDFFLTDRLEKIRRVVTHTGMMEQVYKLYGGDDSFVASDIYHAAPEQRRFIGERIYRGPKREFAMDPSVMCDLMFRDLVRTPLFYQWLKAITGESVSATESINLKSLGADDFLKWHSDQTADGRSVCLVIYLHEKWSQADGTRFLIRSKGGDGSDLQAIDPLPNRMLIFDPRTGTEHAIEDRSNSQSGFMRLNYTVWFH